MPDHGPSHKAEISRLNRVSGQIEGIRKMIEEERYCIDILTQMRAARSALKSLEHKILDTHLSHCVTDAFCCDDQADRTAKIEEIRDLLKKFD